MPIRKSDLNQTVFLLGDPMPWAFRYGDRPNLNCPLFIEFDAPWPENTAQPKRARLLDVRGDAESEWKDAADIEGSTECIHFPVDLFDVVQKHLTADNTAAAYCAVISQAADPYVEGSWNDLWSKVSDGRFEASAWIERDRKHLSLVDLLSGRAVVDLWDDAVDEAFESGFLSPPSRPGRTSDDAWLDPLMGYARSTGALEGLEIAPNPKAASRLKAAQDLA